MELKNYWWLLIWIFLGGAIFSNMPKRRELVAGKMVERWQPLYAILLVLPYIIWAGYRQGIGDTWNYRSSFSRASSNLADIPGLLLGDGKDPGFGVVQILIKFLIGNNADLYLLIIAAFQMLSMMYVFRKYSSDYWTSIFLFIGSCGYISWMMNGVRQFVAVTAVFACFGWLLQRKYIPLLIAILIASTIHQSVLLMIPVVFVVRGEAWNLKTIMMLAVTMVVVVFIDRFLPVMNDLLQNTQYDNALSDLNDDGTNVIRVLVNSVPALMSLVGLKYVRGQDDPVINICVNFSIVTMAISLISMVTSGIYIGRLPIYTTLYGYIALPWMIDCIFEKRSARMMKYMMIIMYCGFFYYQMGIAWNFL